MKFLSLDDNGVVNVYEFDPVEFMENLEYLAQEITYVADDLFIERSQRESADRDLQTAINAKQDKNDNSLQTTSKNLVGAINEINNRSGAIPVNGFYASTTNYTPQQLHDLLGYGSWENVCDANGYNYIYPKAVKSTQVSNIIEYQKLPNVSANLNIYGDSGCGFFSGSSTDQALYPGGTSQTKYMQASNSQTNISRHNIYLDLSKGNAIYQSGADVHPTNYSIYLYRRIA